MISTVRPTRSLLSPLSSRTLNIDKELHACVVDLAAGTSKLSEPLAQREERYETLAVEPHGSGRGVLEGK